MAVNESDPFARIDEVGAQEDVHPVCLMCKKSCKRPYSFWSFQMPPQEFCDDFEEDPKWQQRVRVWLAYVIESKSDKIKAGQILIWRYPTDYATPGLVSDLLVINIDTKKVRSTGLVSDLLVINIDTKKVRSIGTVIGLGTAVFDDEEDFKRRLPEVCVAKVREIYPKGVEG